MVFCTECGAKLPAGSQFCEECGAKINVPEAAVASGGAAGDAAETNASAPFIPNDKADAFKEATGGIAALLTRKKFNRLFIIVPLALIAVALLLLFGSKLMPKSGDGVAPIVYVKDSDTLKFYGTFMKKPAEISSVELNNGSSISTRLSDDKKQLLYLDSFVNGSLYLRNVDSEKPKNKDKSERGIRIASDVSSSFFFTDDGKYVVYVKNDGGLYYHDTKEAYKLDSDIYGGYTPRLRDGNKIFYCKSESGNTYSLYMQTVGAKNGDTLKIDSGISLSSSVSISEDGLHLIYSKASDEGNDVYKYTVKTTDKQKLAGGVDGIFSTDPETSTIIYNKHSSTDINLFDILNIEDDMASADASMTEPRQSDYQKVTQGLFGERNTPDYEAYNEAVSKYRQKLDRDEFRRLLSENHSTNTWDIYANRNGQEEKLVTGLITQQSSVDYASASDGFLIYRMADAKSENTTKISNIPDVYEFYRSMTYETPQLSSKLYYVSVSGGESKSFFSLAKTEQASYITVSEDAKNLVFLVNVPAGEMYHAAISSNGISEPVKVDDDVSTVFDTHDNEFLYIKDEKNEVGSLFALQGASKRKIADDVSSARVNTSGDDDTISFYKEWNQSKSYGDFYIVKGEPRKLSSDVSRAYFRNDKLIYLLKNYNYSSNKGDLYAYVGKDQLTLLDYDVNFVS